MLTSACLIAPMWWGMDADQKASFRREYHHLQKAALKDRLTFMVVQHIITTERSWSGSMGTYYPISWYKSHGYDEAFCQYIEDTCTVRMEGTHKTMP